MNDQTRMILFLALAVAVLVLVSNGKRPLANSPLDPQTPVGDSQTEDDRSLITSRQFANVPSNGPVMPLALMMPEEGNQPIED